LSPIFHAGIVPQLARAATQGGKVDEVALNFMIAVIKGVEPRDQLECMLAAQMAAVHMLSMDFARRLANADNILNLCNSQPQRFFQPLSANCPVKR
jgi:hypothetical protein